MKLGTVIVHIEILFSNFFEGDSLMLPFTFIKEMRLLGLKI